ncbi:MAG: type 1 glutamine amidotransferase domain-containing protein [Proteobacteria bacterium]|nr:type 1 glutamine amidotransferase domain-containing protein [Pseudomonadota bacterium]
MNILIILTSHDTLGDTGEKTGFWLEEFAAPYYALKEAGARITLASPKGGQPPLDPKSNIVDMQTEATRRFQNDKLTQNLLATTEKLSDIDYKRFDAVFYPGGHGPLWDLAEDRHSIALLEHFAANELPIAAVCHAPGVFRHVIGPNGRSIVDGHRVTGFTNSEEEAVGLEKVVPFLVEDMLMSNGARFSKQADWTPYTVVDGTLITGQNPASSLGVSDELVRMLARSKAA